MSQITVRKYAEDDVPRMAEIWDRVVEDGQAYPQDAPLEDPSAFFARQDFCGVAELDGRVVGMYILHPNNVGRCGHMANASYAVDRDERGHGAGEALVRDSLEQGHRLGYRLLVFNAVVKDNVRAISLYEKVGFRRIGEIPGGFRADDGYRDIILFYHELRTDPDFGTSGTSRSFRLGAPTGTF